MWIMDETLVLGVDGSILELYYPLDTIALWVIPSLIWLFDEKVYPYLSLQLLKNCNAFISF